MRVKSLWLNHFWGQNIMGSIVPRSKCLGVKRFEDQNSSWGSKIVSGQNVWKSNCQRIKLSKGQIRQGSNYSRVKLSTFGWKVPGSKFFCTYVLTCCCYCWKIKNPIQNCTRKFNFDMTLLLVVIVIRIIVINNIDDEIHRRGEKAK